MHRSKKVIIMVGLACAIILSFSSIFPAFATDGTIETTFWGDIQDDGNGCGVYMILNLILDILTYGVGIAAIIGISISGITYLTAKGNEQQTIKAKRRIYEIVIGLVAYAALYAALNFLMPGGKLDLGSPCSKASSTSTTSSSSGGSSGGSSSSGGSNGGSSSSGGGSSGGGSKPSSSNTSSYKNSKAYKTCMKKAIFKDKSTRDKVCSNKKGSDRIAKTAELLAASSKKASVQCYPLTQRFSKWSR